MKKTHIIALIGVLFMVLAGAVSASCGGEQTTQFATIGGLMAALPALIALPALGASLEDLANCRSELLDQERSILDNPEGKEGEGESVRTFLTEEQETRLKLLDADLRRIDGMIKTEERRITREDEQRALESRITQRSQVVTPRYSPPQAPLSAGQQRDIGRFSIGRLLRCMVEDKPIDGIEGEMAQEGDNECRELGLNRRGKSIMVSALAFGGAGDQRSLTATGGTGGDQGGMTIATQKASLLEALFPQSVFGQLGATILTGLTSNLDIPRFLKDPSTPAGKAENAAADPNSPTTAMLSLTPKRLPTYVDVSNQLFIQSQESNLETMVRNHIEMVLRSAMQAAFINGDGTTGATGILQTSGIGSIFAGGAAADGTNANGAAPVWKDLVNLESALTGADVAADSAAYLMSTKLVGALKSTPLSGGSVGDASRFIIPQGANGIVNEHRYVGSTSVPSNLVKGASGATLSAMVYGAFVDYVIAQWSGMEFLVDEVTQATTGMTRVHSAVYYNGGVRRPESFAAGDDFVTA